MGTRVEVDGFRIGSGVEAYYFEDLEWGIRAMAVDPDLEQARWRMYEMVAHGLQRVSRPARRLLRGAESLSMASPGEEEFFFLVPGSVAHTDLLAVKALSLVLAEMEPGWIEEVEASRRYAEHPEVLAAWCGVPVEAALVVLGNWRAWI